MSNVVVQQPSLPTSTVAPTSWDLFIPYFNRTYEEIAYNVNNKSILNTIDITNTPQNIPTVPTQGGYLIMVSGYTNGLPTLTAALSKSSSAAAGVVTPINAQAGNVAPWVAATLTITSTATNFQIAHSVGGQTGRFNIRVIGTQ